MKLFPRSPSSTLEPSTTVILPTPPRTKFFNVSEPVGPQFNKHMLDFSRASWPCSPHILKKKIRVTNNDCEWYYAGVVKWKIIGIEGSKMGIVKIYCLSWRSYLVLGSAIDEVLSPYAESAREFNWGFSKRGKKKCVKGLFGLPHIYTISCYID